jgi:hypothetical protein
MTRALETLLDERAPAGWMRSVASMRAYKYMQQTSSQFDWEEAALDAVAT